MLENNWIYLLVETWRFFWWISFYFDWIDCMSFHTSSFIRGNIFIIHLFQYQSISSIINNFFVALYRWETDWRKISRNFERDQIQENSQTKFKWRLAQNCYPFHSNGLSNRFIKTNLLICLITLFNNKISKFLFKNIPFLL